MIFYDCPTAPSPRRARIWLKEKTAPHTVVNIDLMKGEQLGDVFKAINPSCTVPVLQLDDGTILTENSGIAAYLENEFPDPPLLGATSVEKGLVASWTAKIEFEGLQAVAEALRNSSPMMKNRAITGNANHVQIPALAERGLERLKVFLDVLDGRLKGRDFIAIGEFSNADITAAVTLDFANIVRVKAQPHHSNLIRWRQQLDMRPSLAL